MNNASTRIIELRLLKRADIEESDAFKKLVTEEELLTQEWIKL